MKTKEVETTEKDLNVPEIKGYGGKLFEDMTKDELIVITKHLCSVSKHLRSVLKKVQKMDENIDKQVIKTINTLQSENNYLKRNRWW